MIALLRRLFARGAPLLAEAGTRDSAAIAALHGVSFRRGWSEQEVETLLAERNVVAHRAALGARLCGFIISRIAADEAEILSVAVAPARQGHGLARRLLDLHLRQLAGLGCRAVFLEVDEHNGPAIRLYRRAGFREISRRSNYYPTAGGNPVAALVLRRDIA
jgi:ribosomal-protein-alanine N-acetyltransferase